MRPFNAISRNLGLKFLALFLAVVLWFMAVGRERAEVGLNVPLELVNFPPNLVVANQLPDGISVRIRGSVNLTRQVANRQLRFSLDLAGAKKGSNEFTLSPDSLKLPRGLEVTRLTPSTVAVELEGLETKNLSLLPVIKGEPVIGFTIEDITLEPKQVVVKGPSSLMNKVDILWTDPIDVTQLSKTTTVAARPSLPDVAMSLAEPVEVKAHIRIGEKIVTRVFKAVPIEAINTDKNYRLEPGQADLTLKGPLGTITEIATGKAMHVRVNLADLGPGSYNRSVDVSVPPDIKVIGVEPQQVNIEIMIDKAIPSSE